MNGALLRTWNACRPLWALGCVVTLLAVPSVAQELDVPLHAALTVEPAAAAPGDVVELRLQLTVNDPWYVYAQDTGATDQIPLQLRLQLPNGFEVVEDWSRPNVGMVYTAGRYVFRRKIKVAALADKQGKSQGKAAIELSVMYQACTPEFCQPVDILQLSAALQILN